MSNYDKLTEAQESNGPYIGRPMPRFEDERLIKGQGRYTDDFTLPGETYAAFVRSPFGHAKIVSIDITEAIKAPDVLAVYLGQHYADDGHSALRHFANPADNIDSTRRAFVNADNEPVEELPNWPLAIDRVRHVGEPVAVVIARTVAAANDAVELVEVDYDDLPAVVDSLEAQKPDAPQVHLTRPGNIAFATEFGERQATESAIASSHLVVEHTFRNQRIANAQMEPRAAIGSYDQESEVYMMIAGSQGAVRQRDTLALALGVPVERVKVICPDVGGGFGPRTNLYPEQLVVVWASKKVGRSIRWVNSRSESFVSDYQGRDMITRARMGFDNEGRIKGYSIELVGNVGAHTVSFVPMNNGYRIMTSVYDVPVVHADIRGVLTHTVPTAPYRGAGRPEAIFAIERLLDIAAKRLGMDRIEIRQRNLISRDRFPYRTASGLHFDSGDFNKNMHLAMEKADWFGFPKRRRKAAEQGKLAGIGISNYVESPVGIPHEKVEIIVYPEGAVEVVSGTQSSGQGHETSFSQVVADYLGIKPEQVRLITGDTSRVTVGGGTHSDRSMRLGGMLLVNTSAKIIEQCKAVLSVLWDVSVEEIDFSDGCLTFGNKRMGLFDVARAIDKGTGLPEKLRKPLNAEERFSGRIPVFPTGAAICELEVDPDTGEVQIKRYTSIDDVGQPINPLILHGQVHGGIVQGSGQALCESVVAEHDTGQVVTGSFMDYAMPKADMFPLFDVELVEDPTSSNALRVKGGGESGITPATAVIVGALVNALSDLEIEHIEMPATPLRLWELINRKKQMVGRA